MFTASLEKQYKVKMYDQVFDLIRYPTVYYINEANIRKLNKKYDWSVLSVGLIIHCIIYVPILMRLHYM